MESERERREEQNDKEMGGERDKVARGKRKKAERELGS
jgi:hypothetical protein